MTLENYDGNRPILILCDRCQSEGRLLTQGSQVWDEIDNGECPDCDGTGRLLVEAEPVTLKDTQQWAGLPRNWHQFFDGRPSRCLHDPHPNLTIEAKAREIYMARYAHEGGWWELNETPQHWWALACAALAAAADTTEDPPHA